jgi:hypothetical protein
MQMKRTCDAEPVPGIAAACNNFFGATQRLKALETTSTRPFTLTGSERPPTPVPSAEPQPTRPPKCTVPTPYL